MIDFDCCPSHPSEPGMGCSICDDEIETETLLADLARAEEAERELATVRARLETADTEPPTAAE